MLNLNEIPEILLADKPKGITSFDVIRILRRKLGVKKMGHAGTLDPLASGLMIIGVGSGTKRMEEFLKLPKTYVAEILLGKKTDSGDLAGKILEEKDASAVTDEMVREVVEKFSGIHKLAVPMYSAIKVGGSPLYKLARKMEHGTVLSEREKNIVPPVKEMDVKNAKLLEILREKEKVLLKVEFDVGSGAYIRTLAEELGRRLGMPATLQNLRRTKVGEFSIEDEGVMKID